MESIFGADFWSMCIEDVGLCKKNYRFKHTNDDNDIRRRKQQKLDYHIFTCTMSADQKTEGKERKGTQSHK